MRKLTLLLAVVLSVLILPCAGDSKPKHVEKAEMAEDFSLAPGWTGEYKSKIFSINFNNEDMTGAISFVGSKKIIPFKWEEERPSSNRINVKVYVKKKSQFNRKSLKMYNSGWGFTLKMVYLGKDELKMYNGIFMEDGIVTKDDGRVDLHRIVK